MTSLVLHPPSTIRPRMRRPESAIIGPPREATRKFADYVDGRIHGRSRACPLFRRWQGKSVIQPLIEIDDITGWFTSMTPNSNRARSRPRNHLQRGNQVDNGFVVSMPRWESKVTPEGNLRTLIRGDQLQTPVSRDLSSRADTGDCLGY